MNSFFAGELGRVGVGLCIDLVSLRFSVYFRWLRVWLSV